MIAAREMSVIEALLNNLDKEFGVKRIGTPKKFLRTTIVRDMQRKTISLTQEAYVDEALSRFNLESANIHTTPLDPGYKLESTKDAKSDDKASNYLSITGSLNWVESKTRPDVTFATRRLQHRQIAPSEKDYLVAKGVLRYL